MKNAQRVLVIAARHKISKLPDLNRCSDACPGWAVIESGQYGFMVQRCDDCWAGKKVKLYDEEAAALPEAIAALKETIKNEGGGYELAEDA